MIASPYTYGPKMAKIIRFLRAYKRVIVWLLVVAYAAFKIVHPDEDGPVLDLFFIASQFFWIRRALDLAEQFIPGKPRRAWLALIAGAVYLFFFVYSFTHSG